MRVSLCSKSDFAADCSGPPSTGSLGSAPPSPLAGREASNSDGGGGGGGGSSSASPVGAAASSATAAGRESGDGVRYRGMHQALRGGGIAGAQSPPSSPSRKIKMTDSAEWQELEQQLEDGGDQDPFEMDA